MWAAKKTVFLLFAFALVVFSLSTGYAEKIEAVIEGKEVLIVKTADNFIIMYDSSGSMDSMYRNTTMKEIDAEISILKEKISTLPELNWQAGIVSHTPRFSLKSLKTYLPMQVYNKDLFAKTIDTLPTEASGATLLQGGLRQLGDVLAGLDGKTVVFLFTDGQYSHMDGMARPGAIARGLADKYNVCFYVIDTGAGKEGGKAVKAIGSVTDCSKVIPFADLLGRPEWLTSALFVVEEKEILEVVTDKETIIEVAEGNAIVAYEWKNILFDFNKATVRPDDYEDLAAIATFLIENPELRLVLAGYADSIGTVEYNKTLSERRAAAVRDFLVIRAGIDAGRITLSGFGEKAPVATNMYEAGRQQNRRVQGFITGM